MHGGPEPAQERRALQRHFGIVEFGYGLDYRQSEAASGRLGAGDAIEPIKNADTIRLRDSRPAVLDAQDNRPLTAAYRYFHPAAMRRVANGIVQEIAHQDAQCIGMTRDRCLVGVPDLDIDLAQLGCR